MRISWSSFVRRFAATMTVLAGLALPAAAAAAGPPDRCASLRSLQLPNIEIVKAEVVTGTYTEDVSVGRAMRTYKGLPTFCRIYGFSRPVAGSRIGFEVWMPASGWTHRMHMIGGGAYVSNISYEEMIPRIKDGDVAVGTDTGHTGTDLRFGRDNRQAIIDYSYRAVHETAVAGKAITKAYYGSAPAHSYFSGCSTGGYQGLSEAQRYPDDFDGIIAGAPGNNRTNLTLAFVWNYLANHRPGDDLRPILEKSDLLTINRAAVAECDMLDGVRDSVIGYPPACRFRVSSLLCKKRATPGTCLTAEQVAAAQKIYDGPRDARTGRQIFPGLPVGSEGILASTTDSSPGWSGYWSNGQTPSEPLRADIFRYWVFHDPDWNWWKFNWGTDVDTVDRRLAPIFNATDPNLEPFQSAGGKLLMFIGWNDSVGSAWDAINYYQAVEDVAAGASAAERRSDAQRFARLYVVPGMDHCAGGPGATNMSTATRDSVPPVSDASHDMTRAIEQWVERGVAPGTLVATHYYVNGFEGTPPAKRPIAFQRPLCVYPERPVYRGGPSNVASSFSCTLADGPGDSPSGGPPAPAGG